MNPRIESVDMKYFYKNKANRIFFIEKYSFVCFWTRYIEKRFFLAKTQFPHKIVTTFSLLCSKYSESGTTIKILIRLTSLIHMMNMILMHTSRLIMRVRLSRSISETHMTMILISVRLP